MDHRKIIMFLFLVFLNVLRWFCAVIGVFGLVIFPIEIARIWYLYNTDPKEHDWDKQIEETGKNVKAFFQAFGICGMAFGCHFGLLTARDLSIDVVKFKPRFNMDSQKIVMILFITYLNVIKWFFAAVGCLLIVLTPIAIVEIWYEYNTDPKEHDWDKHVERTGECVKGCFAAVAFCIMAWCCDVVLIEARDHYQKYIRKHRKDCKAMNVSAPLIHKKDTAMVNITVGVTVQPVAVLVQPASVTVQPVTVTVQPVIQSTEGPPCYHI